MNFMKDIRTTITTTEQINRIIDKYEAEQEEADDTEDLYGDAPTDEYGMTGLTANKAMSCPIGITGRKGYTLNKKERCDAVCAMELLARAVNNENFFEEWLISGVADGDINADTKDEDLDYYVEDDTVFADLMDTFLHVMKNAQKDGGLYVDGVVSKPDPSCLMTIF